MSWRDFPNSSVTWRRHSKAAGASLIQGDATTVPGIAVNPAACNSSRSAEKGTEQTCIASAIACDTMLTVNTSVRRMLSAVSLNDMSGWFSTPSARIGGSADKQLKKLNGAALIRPSLRIDRGHQRDRPRYHGADHQLVAITRRQRTEVERHVVRRGDGVHHLLPIDGAPAWACRKRSSHHENNRSR